jgi:hypothetical protein
MLAFLEYEIDEEVHDAMPMQGQHKQQQGSAWRAVNVFNKRHCKVVVSTRWKRSDWKSSNNWINSAQRFILPTFRQRYRLSKSSIHPHQGLDQNCLR